MNTMKIAAMCAALLLSACSATGSAYEPMPVRKGEAKVVVYRTPNGAGAPISVNEVKICNMRKNGHAVFTAKAGESFLLSSYTFGDIHESIYSVVPRSGETHYVRVELNSASLVGSVFGVLGASFISNEGSFAFRDGNKEEALLTREEVSCNEQSKKTNR